MAGKTTGMEPMLYKAPTIKIVGKEYKMRRLGIFDVSRLAAILSSSGGTVLSKVVTATFKNMQKEKPKAEATGKKKPRAKPSEKLEETKKKLKAIPIAEWIEAIVFALPEITYDVVSFLASTVKDFKGDIKDGDQFPLGTELEIVDNLLESEDVVAFFARGLKLSKSQSIKKIGAMFSGDKSTSSKKPTAGPTKKS